MQLERIDTPSGRFYKTPEGFLYPSVTTILGTIPNPELQKWIDSIGKEEASKVSKRATTNGTRLHDFCENYLLGNNPQLDIFQKDSYGNLPKILDQITPIALEKMTYSNKLRAAGTLDCLGVYKGKYHIIDWKTTSKLKHDGEFDTYWLQVSAYAMMIYEHTGIFVNDLMIVMQDLVSSETRIFTAKTVDWLPKFIEIRNKLTF